MTPRTFWILLIRIIAVFILLESLTSTPQVLSTFLYLLKDLSATGGDQSTVFAVLYLIIVLLIYVWFIRYCCFKTTVIIDILKLDQGFDEERFNFTINYAITLRISVIVIGAVLIIENLPLFIRNTFTYFQHINKYAYFKDFPSSAWIVYDLAKICVGYFMLSCSKMIADYLNSKSKDAPEGAPSEDY